MSDVYKFKVGVFPLTLEKAGKEVEDWLNGLREDYEIIDIERVDPTTVRGMGPDSDRPGLFIIVTVS